MSSMMAKNVIRGGTEQALLGLMSEGLLIRNVSMPQEQFLKVLQLRHCVENGNEEINRGIRELKELLDARGIEFIVVKGQAVGSYYPNPLLRQAGDIDFYCDAENFPKAMEAIREAWGVTEGPNGSLHHIHFDHQDVVYEAHFRLRTFYSKKIDRYWQEIVDGAEHCTVMVDGMAVKTLSPTVHIVFVFIHLYDHLLGLGVALRQFCDMAVMLHACREEIDLARMREILKTLGMERAFRAIGCILIEQLGMPAEDLGYEVEDKDRKYVKRIMGIVRYRGNMGHYNKKEGFKGWRHNIESAAIKISHFMKLWPLAPGYSLRWIIYDLTKKFRQLGT